MQNFITSKALLLMALYATAVQASYGQTDGARWNRLPPTPHPLSSEVRSQTKINGIILSYASAGQPTAGGTTVILLHGGLGNSDYWGHQVRALASHHQVIVVDSRGHGRSTRDGRPYGYDLMADDVVGLMNLLHITQADLVGWSDGAIISLDIALRFPERVRRVFAFAANTQTSGLIPDGDKDPNFARFIARAGTEYRALSPTPEQYPAFVTQISHMWEDQPDWTDAQLASIKARVLIADGDHDEVIRREHTEYIARSIPGAGLLILPNTSHFAFLQDPALFNAALLDFLDSK